MPRERCNFICSVDGCGKDAHAKGWCRQHWSRMHLYGRLEKINGIEKGNCKVEGCDKPIKGKGLCANHYQRQRKYGRTEKIKKESKTKHPFYHLWFERKQNKDLWPEWLDFWTFVKDITPKPEGNYFLTKLHEGPYGPLNFKWTEKLKQQLSETNSEFWARAWEAKRIRNPDEEYERNLQRNFGISLEQYNEKFQNQNGKCAICNNEENLIKAGRMKRLAVDHCHITNRIRDLLCFRCNTLLGKINEDLELVDKIRNYLVKHNSSS